MAPRQRPTIRDIAREAGVSSGAVSFALNGRPGVSDETRARVIEVAQRLGWTPSVAARALSSQQARAVGLVIARPAASVAAEAFYLRLIAGIEQVLTSRSISLVLQMVDNQSQEVLVHRRWWAERRVDGVFLTDPTAEDIRPGVLAELGLPGVVIGGSEPADGLSAVATDDAGAMTRVVTHLVALGHMRLAHVSGTSGLIHTARRARAFAETVEQAGGTVVPVPPTDFTEDAGHRATDSLLDLGQDERPTAIVYDNELLALGGVAAIDARHLRIPGDVAVVSWEDSPVCRVIQPPLTALRREPEALGAHAAELLLRLVEGQGPDVLTEDLPELVVRPSTG